MKTFKEYVLNEKFHNFFTADRKQKEKYVDEVWDLLQAAYADIGGIKGSGFGSKEDMIDKIPFWKIDVKKGKVISVNLYKDKGGRKLVATATDGSRKGMDSSVSTIKAASDREYGEKSKRALGLAIKTYGNKAKDVMVPVVEVKQIMRGKEVIAVTDYIAQGNKLEDDDAFTVEKYPQFIQFMYVRKIKGHYHLKIMFGVAGKTINK